MTNKLEISRDKGRFSVAATGYGIIALMLCFVAYFASISLPAKIEKIARDKASAEISEAVTQATPKSNPLILSMAVDELSLQIAEMREEIRKYRYEMRAEVDDIRLEYRLLERGIDPACIDREKEGTRSAAWETEPTSFLPDHLNFYGQEQVVRDRQYGVYWTEPSEYDWKYPSCVAKMEQSNGNPG